MLSPTLLVTLSSLLASPALAWYPPNSDVHGSPLLSTLASNVSSSLASTSLTTCLTAKKVPFSSPSASTSTAWASLIAPYNSRLPFTPAAVASPATVAQVQSAVKCAAAADVPVQARGGGHAYNSASLGGQDGALVLDMGAFASLSVSSSTGVAAVGAGMRLGDVARGLWAKGQRALPHGSCPYVGVGGHASQGGFGYAGRMWGLALDQIEQLDVVFANGTAGSVSAKSDPDAFFAFAGAAPSFGVITEYHFKTYEAPKNVVYFAYSFNGGSSVQLPLFMAFQSFVTSTSSIKTSAGATKGIPKELGISLELDQGWAQIRGTFAGSEADFNIVIKGLLAQVKPDSKKVSSQDWIDTVRILAQGQQLNTAKAKDTTDTFYAKSLVTPEAKLITKAAASEWIDYINDASKTPDGTAFFILIDTYGGPNSAVNQASLSSKNSYGHRDALFVMQMYLETKTGKPPFPTKGISYMQGMSNVLTDAMGSSWDHGAYVNYPDPELRRSMWENRYYGASTYARLQKIKKVLDKGNLFRGPQTVAANE